MRMQGYLWRIGTYINVGMNQMKITSEQSKKLLRRYFILVDPWLYLRPVCLLLLDIYNSQIFSMDTAYPSIEPTCS